MIGTCVCVLRTCQVGHAVGVDFKLVTFQMLADESQQSVQDSHCPRYRGGWRVPVAWTHNTQGNRKLIKMTLASFTLPTLHNLDVIMHNLSVFFFLVTDHLWVCISEGAVPLRRWPTRAKLKFALKFKPTKWSICLQCHSNGRLISMNTSSGLWTRRIIYCKNYSQCFIVKI